MTTKSIESTNNTRRVPGIYELARGALSVVGFDLLEWKGTPVRVVSAWKIMPTKILSQRDHDDDEASTLFWAVSRDLSEAKAIAGFDDDGQGDERDVREWFASYIELADAYGAERWPVEALVDYLRGYEGVGAKDAEAMAQRAWDKACILYGNFKFANGEPPIKAA